MLTEIVPAVASLDMTFTPTVNRVVHDITSWVEIDRRKLVIARRFVSLDCPFSLILWVKVGFTGFVVGMVLLMHLKRLTTLCLSLLCALPAVPFDSNYLSAHKSAGKEIILRRG